MTPHDFILSQQWAITPEYLSEMLAIAERRHEFAGKLEALEQKLGKRLENTYDVSVRDGVAIISATGPMFRYASWFHSISGGTSYQILSRDIRAALDDPSITGILLNVDSPGGEVNGAQELASQIVAGRKIKPIYAYIGGTGASAGYWLASAAEKVFAAESAIIGSIGVQMAMTIRGDAPGSKSYRFVSSQSPMKNAGPDTEAGAAEIQRVVDSLAQIFVGAVADNRGISTEKVLEDFGQGKVFVGSDALARGMIDEISTFEGVLNQLAQGRSASGTSVRYSMDIKSMTVAQLAEARPDLVAQIEGDAKAKAASEFEPKISAAKDEGAKAERERISAIQEMAFEGQGELVASLIGEGKSVAEAAIAINKAAKAGGVPAAPKAEEKSKEQAALDALKQTEAGLEAPAQTASTEGKTTTTDRTAEILANAKLAGVTA